MYLPGGVVGSGTCILPGGVVGSGMCVLPGGVVGSGMCVLVHPQVVGTRVSYLGV